MADYTLNGVVGTIPREPAPGQNNPEDVFMFERTTCNTLVSKPPTPDLVVNDPRIVSYRREVNHSDVKVLMPDGEEVSVWIFEDMDTNEATFPSKPIRVREGQILQSFLKSRHGVHSIHHHGLEPETINDGVGHISFEAQEYLYQFTLREGSAGTYFYHCHRNTTLHFEMGMYGMLIVDPPEGPGRVFEGGPRYDKEYIWAVDEIDPSWRMFTTDPAQDPFPTPASTPENKFGIECNAGESFYGSVNPALTTQFPFYKGLSHFNPMYYLISGVPAPLPPDRPLITDPSVAITCQGGEHVLLRLLNAGYTYHRYTFGLPCTVVATDARPLGSSLHPHTKYSRPYTVPANTPISLSTGRRWDLIFRPKIAGVYPVVIEFIDWVTQEVRATVETTITVTNTRFMPTGAYQILFE